jgi:hypothetical protein
MATTRKGFLAQTVGAGAALASSSALLEAVPARAGSSRRCLSLAEDVTLGCWCDHLVPGARAGGVVDFVGEQLAKHPDDALLGIRYFGWPPPWDDFYRDGVAALDGASKAAFGRPFWALRSADRERLHQRLLTGSAGWSAPAPFFLFFLVTRSDAVDVVYGVPSGYARLGVRYAPQVRARSPW